MLSLALLSLAVAGPFAAATASPQRTQSRTTSLKTVRNPKAAGLTQHARSLAKFGGAVPEHLSNLVSRGWATGRLRTFPS